MAVPEITPSSPARFTSLARVHEETFGERMAVQNVVSTVSVARSQISSHGRATHGAMLLTKQETMLRPTHGVFCSGRGIRQQYCRIPRRNNSRPHPPVG